MVDHGVLLEKYMQIVFAADGSTFVSYASLMGDGFLTEEEGKTLLDIDQDVRRRAETRG